MKHACTLSAQIVVNVSVSSWAIYTNNCTNILHLQFVALPILRLPPSQTTYMAQYLFNILPTWLYCTTQQVHNAKENIPTFNGHEAWLNECKCSSHRNALSLQLCKDKNQTKQIKKSHNKPITITMPLYFSM